MTLVRHLTCWAVITCLSGFALQAGFEGDFLSCGLVGGLVGYLISVVAEDSTKWDDPIHEWLGRR